MSITAAYLLILVLVSLNCIQGWIILYQLLRMKKQQDQMESELKQFRGVAKLKDLPKRATSEWSLPIWHSLKTSD